MIALCDPMTNKVVQCGPRGRLTVTPFDNCSGNNVTASIVTTTNGYCPQVITRTWSLADPCGNTNTLLQTVTIVDTNPPMVLCSAGANLVPNEEFESYSLCPTLSAKWPRHAVVDPTDATADYFNSCALTSLLSIPNNGVGGQTPFSGQAYGGILAYCPDVNNSRSCYREYSKLPCFRPSQLAKLTGLLSTSVWRTNLPAPLPRSAHIFRGRLSATSKGY